MIFPLAWAAAFAVRGKVLGMVSAALLTLAVVFSTARGVWIGGVCGGLLLGLLEGGRKGVGLLAAAAGVATLAVVASPGLREQAAPLFTLGGANAGRAAIYRANLDIVHDHPVLGLGFGRYKARREPVLRSLPRGRSALARAQQRPAGGGGGRASSG